MKMERKMKNLKLNLLMRPENTYDNLRISKIRQAIN
jgi:hypothetical protein